MSFVAIADLSKAYGNVTALDSLSLEVERGHVMALVGPDGAGKTTMIRVLCGLLAADGGTVRVGDTDVLSHFEEIKPDLGYMPQQFSLYPDLSVEENMIFYAGIYGITGEDYRRRRDELYEFSRLGEFAGRRAEALSGGMKQKLALSCALLHDPKLLVLDEPTTGVDPLSRRQFWEILLNLRDEGVTILVSTPYMDEVARADNATFIFDGKQLAAGDPESLAADFDGHVYYLDREPTSAMEANLDQIDGIDARRFGAGFHLYLSADDDISSYRDSLESIDVKLEDIKAVKPTLEDRFIQLMEHRT